MMQSESVESLVVSKERVAEHGEVYTPSAIVNAMLDLVKPETENIESRFLEPACGTGNFLTVILERKLRVVESRYRRNQLEYERKALTALCSIYGIDKQEDNVIECRARLLTQFIDRYRDLYKEGMTPGYNKSAEYVLKHNIVWGDARALVTVDDERRPIVFSEWSAVNGSFVKRRDYVFREIMPPCKEGDLPLLPDYGEVILSDLGENAFHPIPVKTYPPVHFLRLADADE